MYFNLYNYMIYIFIILNFKLYHLYFQLRSENSKS